MSKRDPSTRRTPAARGLTPESERKGVQIKLRLPQVVADRLRAIATERGITLAALVTQWVEGT